MADFSILETYSPICEKSVRPDGTVGIKIIAPGWGSSGYYSEDVLRRDVPAAFPAGTQMFWNHPTANEEYERPEGDLHNLAGVIVSPPRWESSGAKGPGMYADAKVFPSYAETLNQIGEYIGVSVRGGGKKTNGTAEGREGAIITELSIGKSVDFVTRPGAGGAILSIYESAPGAPKIFDIRESRNLAEWVESRLHLALTELADNLFGDGFVNREERISMSAALGAALDAYRASLISAVPDLYTRLPFSDALSSADVVALNQGVAPETATEGDVTMSNQLQQEIEALRADNQRLTTMLKESEAREFLARQFSAADIPDVTKTRLQRQLLAHVPVTANGRIDEAAYTVAVEAAINEARAEFAAALGDTGRVRGAGNAAPAPSTISESEASKRLDAALKNLGGARWHNI